MNLISSFLAVATILLVPFAGQANPIYGSWINENSGARIDILDGFKPGTGAFLAVNGSKVRAGTWTEKNSEVSLRIGYETFTVLMDGSDRLALKPNYGESLSFNRLVSDETTETISLKDDPTAFISKLQSKVWITSLEGQYGIFKPTFATDSGVLELTNGETLTDLRSWSVSSGVLKISGDVIVEARVNEAFFVGLNERDNFVVFRATDKAQVISATDLKSEREEFFNQLLTGEWISTSYTVSTVRFRPVFGELSGKVISTTEGRLSDQSNWEYSPSTGALKLGYTEYKGALIVNGTLALLKENGDQVFYNRSQSSSDKRYTLADIKQTALNENSLSKVQEMLSLQTYSNKYLYSWEFNADGRTGYLHKWQSEPFAITGETMDQEGKGESNTLRQVEEFLIFDDDEVYQLDTSISRLRPKTDAEALADAETSQRAKENALTKQLTVRITTKSGETIDVEIPLGDFAEISNLSILSE